jgi:hypothetical protein
VVGDPIATPYHTIIAVIAIAAAERPAAYSGTASSGRRRILPKSVAAITLKLPLSGDTFVQPSVPEGSSVRKSILSAAARAAIAGSGKAW